MKVFLADGMLSASANTVFSSHDVLKTLDAWMGVLAFSGQIFFDFAGYSSCAIGAALCLGFVLPQNFLFPYAAVGFTDFWRRWHITLSSWLRDYLYIPTRRKPQREIQNLFQPDDNHAAWRSLAWSKLDLCGMGCLARILFMG